MVALLVYLLLPADSIFRDDKGMLASFKAPIMQSIVSLLFVFTGALNFHSNCEFMPMAAVEKSCLMTLKLVELITK